MSEKKKEGVNHFYIVSLQVNLLTGEKAHTMRGLGTVEPLTYQDLEDAARRDHKANVDNVIILYKEKITKAEYKSFWTRREDVEEKAEEK